jgi:hypothetical protein
LASIKLTPLSSANGIFIEFTLSSGVMSGNPSGLSPMRQTRGFPHIQRMIHQNCC